MPAIATVRSLGDLQDSRDRHRAAGERPVRAWRADACGDSGRRAGRIGFPGGRSIAVPRHRQGKCITITSSSTRSTRISISNRVSTGWNCSMRSKARDRPGRARSRVRTKVAKSSAGLDPKVAQAFRPAGVTMTFISRRDLLKRAAVLGVAAPAARPLGVAMAVRRRRSNPRLKPWRSSRTASANRSRISRQRRWTSSTRSSGD